MTTTATDIKPWKHPAFYSLDESQEEIMCLKQALASSRADLAKSELDRIHQLDFYTMRCSELTQQIETLHAELNKRAPNETQNIRRDADFYAMRAE